jgi:signal transduction histidine kinase
MHDLEGVQLFGVHAGLILASLRHQRALLELDELKSEFVSNVSHEIRTPITAIGGAIELLEGHLGALKDSEKVKMLLGLINRNMVRMHTLVNDLLDFSRLETGRMKLNLSCFSLKKMIEETVQDLELRARKKNISLTADCPPEDISVTADAERVKQVLVNLLGNAVKFTPEGGNVQISFQAEDSKWLVIRVTDTGIGIPKDKQERIFDKFYQVDGSATREHQGFGLGLAIVKSILDHHGAAIRVESVPGKGAAFIIHMPVASRADQ